MKLSASAKVAIKRAYEYIKACENPSGVHAWYQATFKGEHPTFIPARMKAGASNWEHFFNMGFTHNDLRELYKEAYPDGK